jgi:MFS transporter, DHA1 family, multidrug resistance protein
LSSSTQGPARGEPGRARSSPAAVSRTAVGAVVFVVAVAAFSRIPLLPDIGADLTLTAGEIGLLTTAFGLGRLGMDVPAGRLTQAAPAYVGLAGAGALLALSCGILAIAGSLAVAAIASVLIGCASALTNTTGMFAFATATGVGRRGASMALFTTALMTGQMVGPALGGLLGSLLGWREAIAIAAAAGIAVTAACLRWRRTARRRLEHGHPAGSDEPAQAAERPVESRRGRAGPSPSRRELIALGTTPFACFFALAGLTQTLIPVIGSLELDLSASTIGLAIAAGAAVRFLAAWVAGAASDRGSRKAVLVPSQVLMAVGGVAMAFSTEIRWWGAAIALLAIGSSGISVAAAALADRVPAERLGHELGMFRLVGDLGLLVGPATVAFLYQESGPELAGAVSAAVFAVAALVAALWVAPGRPRDAADTGELLIE